MPQVQLILMMVGVIFFFYRCCVIVKGYSLSFFMHFILNSK